MAFLWFGNWNGAKNKFSQKRSGQKNQQPLRSIVSEGASCEYPEFVVTDNSLYENSNGIDFEEIEAAVEAARVGPNPQSSVEANYTVIYNFVSPSTKSEKSNNYEGDDDDDDDDNDVIEETDEDHVTLVTHATAEFLYPNLVNLIQRWPEHPISVSVYSPGDDFCVTSAVVSWLWTCHKEIRRQVSFHVFFPANFVNDIASKTASDGIRILDVNCSIKPDIKSVELFRKKESLPYPVNTARNVARSSAKTRHVLTSDIELFPSPNLASNFINYIQAEEEKRKESKLVYVVPTFEIEEGEKLPENKAELVQLYNQDKAVYFHKFSCKHCQLFPDIELWLENSQSGFSGPDQSVQVFSIAARHPPFERWEPIYIGTQNEPLYDERLSWEGFQDKMTQMHELCLLDYRFAILDTAFLVHSPGIKKKKTKKSSTTDEEWRQSFVQNNQRVYKDIISEFRKKYRKATLCQEFAN